jgi:hypothetical protein
LFFFFFFSDEYIGVVEGRVIRRGEERRGVPQA